MDGIDITQTHLQLAKSFSFLGQLWKEKLNRGRNKGKIFVGNETIYANEDLFKSKLFNKNSKLRMYKIFVRPAVTYVCETGVLKEI